MNWLVLPGYAVHLKDRCTSFFSADGDIDLEQRQVHGIMLVSALVSRDYSLASGIEESLRNKAELKTIAIAKYAAIFAEKKKNENSPPLLETKEVETDFWIYVLAASFICSFSAYIKLRSDMEKNTVGDKDIVNDVIRIAATVQTISEIHKIESEHKKRILVVDDEVRLTRLLKRTLESTGQFEVKTENNGINVAEVARGFKPDLILLDVLMPEKSGVEVARQIRKDNELCHTKIVFLTGLLGKESTGNLTKEIEGCLCLAKSARDDNLIYYIDKQIGESING